jgi:hypothetical protein
MDASEVLASIDIAHRDLECDATTESVIAALSLAVRVCKTVQCHSSM